MNKFSLGVALAAFAAAGAAYAVEGPNGPRPMWDANRDATVSRTDIEARAGAMFDRLDANHDGKLDMADRAARDAQIFDRIDADHNGQISRDEFTAFNARGPAAGNGAPPPPMGDEAAGGADGPAHDAGPGHDGPDQGGPGQGGPDRMGGGHGPRGDMSEGPMRMNDTDGNGSISKAEFVAAGLGRFDAMDSDHDGKLTAAERQAARGPGAMRRGMQMRGGPGSEPAPPPPPQSSSSAPTR